MDVVAILVILYMRRRFRAAIKDYTNTYDKKVVEIADYAVLVTGLPASQTVDDVEKGLHRCAHATFPCLPLEQCNIVSCDRVPF